jgi:hypothetical protein
MRRPEGPSLFDEAPPTVEEVLEDLAEASPPAAASDPWTSFAAARHAAGGAGSQRRRVLMLLWEREARGATNTEIEAELGMNRPSGSNRRLELERAGLCRATTMHRPTPTGDAAVVYQITTLGQQVAEAIAAEEAQQP